MDLINPITPINSSNQQQPPPPTTLPKSLDNTWSSFYCPTCKRICKFDLINQPTTQHNDNDINSSSNNNQQQQSVTPESAALDRHKKEFCTAKRVSSTIARENKKKRKMLTPIITAALANATVALSTTTTSAAAAAPSSSSAATTTSTSDKNKIFDPKKEQFLLERRFKQYDPSQYGWCRYCGSEATSSWGSSPWGPRKLCQTCYLAWKKNKTLTFPAHIKNKEPSSPINRAVNSEYDYLARMEKKRKKAAATSNSKSKNNDSDEDDD
jgi:hypothetical protein